MKLLNFGSLNYDYVYRVAHIARPGETIASAQMQTFPGGKGLNQSIALARAGMNVSHAGMVGEEGDELLQICADNGICTDYIRKISGKSGHTIIQVDDEAQNSIILYGGSNQCITREFADEVLSHFSKGDYLLLQNEISELPYIIEQAAKIGMKIVLNPSPYNGKIELCDLSRISCFLLNEIEGEQITGEHEPGMILGQMQKKYPQSAVVLTLGEKGAVYAKDEYLCKQGVFRVNPVDTTAAGDTFTGYFVAAVLSGEPIEKALRLASKAAAVTVMRQGAATGIPTREEVDAMDFDSLEMPFE